MSKRSLNLDSCESPYPKRSTRLVSTADGQTIKNFFELSINVLISPEKMIEFCQKKKIFSEKKNCPKCDKKMELKPRADAIDKYRWECSDSKCKKSSSIRTNTWFAKSKLSIRQILITIYSWYIKLPQNLAANEAYTSERTMVDWYSFCRCVCVDFIVLNSEQIGGIIVEKLERLIGFLVESKEIQNLLKVNYIFF